MTSGTSGNSEARKRAKEQAQTEQMHRSRIAGEQAAIRFAGRDIPRLPNDSTRAPAIEADRRGSLLHARVHLLAALEEIESELRHSARATRPARGVDSHPVYNANTDPCDTNYGPCACGAWHKPATDVLGSVLQHGAEERAAQRAREADPELERLLAEEEEIERRTRSYKSRGY